MTERDEINEEELVQRMLYAFLKPVVRLASRFRVPMKTIATLVQTAYFQELRDSGATLDEAADRLGVSRRSAARLSSRLKSRFLAPEMGHNLPRRIEFMLGAEPMSATRIHQVMRESRDDIDAAIETLVVEERIELLPGRTPVYRPTPGTRELPRDSWVRRVGALTSLMENLGDAAYGRFFGALPTTFLRTLTFRAPPESSAELEEMFYESVLGKVTELRDRVDAVPETHADADRFQLSVCWAPCELLRSENEEAERE